MLAIFLFCIILLISISFGYEKDGDVLILNKNNFIQSTKDHSHILILFYSPTCEHYPELVSDFSKAATNLVQNNNSFTLAKFDVTELTFDEFKTYRIHSFPSLKSSINGNIEEYSGDYEVDDIINWVIKKSKPLFRILSTKEEFESFRSEYEITIIGFVEPDTPEYRAFESVATFSDKYDFGIVLSNKELAESINVHNNNNNNNNENTYPNIFLFKRTERTGVAHSGVMTRLEIQQFILSSTLPSILTYSEKNSQNIFSIAIDIHLIYFNDPNSNEHKDFILKLEEISKEYFREVLCIFVPSSETSLLEEFGVNQNDLPKLFIAEFRESSLFKNSIDNIFDINNIKTSLSNILSKKQIDMEEKIKKRQEEEEKKQQQEQEQKPKSAPPPIDNSGLIKILVSSTLNEFILNSEKDVLVLFYVPWCRFCRAFSNTYNEISEIFNDSREIIVAQFDASENDIVDNPVVSNLVTAYPTLLFFPRNKKSSPIKYPAGDSVEDIIEFLQEYTSFQPERQHFSKEEL